MPKALGRLASAALSTFSAVVLATTAAPALADVRGPDVSSHQHPYGAAIKWSSAAAGGTQFAFVKASEGSTYTNPYFAGDFAGVRSAGIVRGAYHYAHPTVGTASALAQARHFVDVTGPLKNAGDLPPVLDLERNDGLTPTALITWTRAYLDEVQRLTGRTPIIYTYPNFWRYRMANTTAFNSYPLWIATYGPQPTLIGGWTTYAFWQYTDKAVLAGFTDPVDMSLFNGSRADLDALARVTPPAAKRFAPKVTASLSARKVHVQSSVTLKGSTSRKLAGETATRQGYWSGSWHTWATTKVSSTGRYTFTIRPTRKAVNTYRVYVRATSKHKAAASPKLTLRVS